MKKAVSLYDSVRLLPNVGEVRAAALEKMGVHTVRDLLMCFPRSYENRGNIRRLTEGTDGIKSAFLLTVGTAPRTVRLRGRMTLTKFRAFDDSGTVDVVFYNQDYVRQVFSVGAVFRFWGTLHYSKTWTLSSPAYEPYREGEVLPDYIPLYSLTNGITRKVMESLIDAALAMPIPDFLPETIRLSNHLPTLAYALREIHHPESPKHLESALRRLVFDELFCLSVGIAANRKRDNVPQLAPFEPYDFTPLLTQLPYSLTGAQQRVLAEITSDMTGGTRTVREIPAMRRILIGDVGSGKTVCAMAAIYLTVKNGCQAALMAPTEILAAQHYRDMKPLFEALGFEVALLTGSTPAKEKRRILDRIANPLSPLPILIGTHALLEDNIRFSNLKLTITDEQHRFGIMQRSALTQKANGGHLLVMSATPIPRTLALSLYGDLSISRLDEMPAGRQRVDTFVVDDSYRERLNGFIAAQVADGGQVYIVCPAIEDSDEEEPAEEVPLDSLRPVPHRPLKSAETLYKQLKEQVFPHLSVGLLHGKMKPAEKEAIMTCFEGGDIDILVSTTVIEVGVNVPNANLIVVENAENFGLSQLHQLRGRVGRGKRKSYCILISESGGDAAKARLRVMTTTYDGYEIAERDLALRGPGDFFSGACDSQMRQSGGVRLRLAKCCDDTALMNAAFAEASRVIQSDPALTSPEHAPLRAELANYFNTTENSVS